MTTTWINKKKKDNKKFYGYTGPVKPETPPKWISKIFLSNNFCFCI